MQSLIGTTLAGRYELLEQIGSGGMSVVYKARNVQLDNICCVKVLRQQVFGGDNSLRRLQREAKMLAALDHPNILRIIAMDSEGDQYFLVTEFIDGQNLSEMIGKSPMAPERVKKLFLQLAGALQYAHGKGIVHRDLKPSNVMVVKEGESETAKILDFGIAKILQADTFQKLTQTGAIVGTAQYIAPEQCATGEVDARSDIYSLGCMLYESLTGRAPFSGESAMEVMLKHTTESPPVAAGLLGTVAAQAMAKNPAERFQSAAEFAAALDVGGAAPRQFLSPKRARSPRKRILVAAALAAVSGGALLISSTILKTEPSPAELYHLAISDEVFTDPRTNVDLYGYLAAARMTNQVYQSEFAHAADAFIRRKNLTARFVSEACQFKGRTLQRGSRPQSNYWFIKSTEIANANDNVNEWATYELASNLCHEGNPAGAGKAIAEQIRIADKLGLDRGRRAFLSLTMADDLSRFGSFASALEFYNRAFSFERGGSFEQGETLHKLVIDLLWTDHKDCLPQAKTLVKSWSDKYYPDAGESVRDEIAFMEADIDAHQSNRLDGLEKIAEVVSQHNKERTIDNDDRRHGILQYGRVELALAQFYLHAGQYAKAKRASRLAFDSFAGFDQKLEMDAAHEIEEEATKFGE